MRGVGGYGRGASRLATAKRRLLQAAAIVALPLPGALMLADVACGQVAAALPEVGVTAPRPPPRRGGGTLPEGTVRPPRPPPVRRAARATTPARAARPARLSAPAPSPAPQIPA